MTLAGSVINETVRTVACKRVLNLSNLEYSCPDPDPNQEYGSVSRLGFYLGAASLEKTVPSKVFLNIVLVSCVYPRFWQFVSKTKLEFLNNLGGLGTE